MQEPQTLMQQRSMWQLSAVTGLLLKAALSGEPSWYPRQPVRKVRHGLPHREEVQAKANIGQNADVPGILLAAAVALRGTSCP